VKYPYIIPQPEVYKPYIPVILNFKKTHKVTSNIMALVDSGADVCFCSENIAFWLGSKDSKSKEHKEFTAANGESFFTYREDINLFVAGKSYICPFYISKKLPQPFPIILGQLGFFDHFSVKFDLPHKEIEIL